MNLRMFAAATIGLLLVAPSYALTVEEAQREMGGLRIGSDGKTGTRQETVSSTVQNPDTVTVTEIPGSESKEPDNSGLATWCPKISTMNGGWTYPSNVNADCVPQSLSPNGGGGPTFVTVVTPGGTSVVVSCVTTSRTMSHGGGAWTENWSVSAPSQTSTSGAC